MKISHHAVLRYLERFHNIDFTDLKFEFMAETGVISINRVIDKEFVQWLFDNGVDITFFKKELRKFIDSSELLSERTVKRHDGEYITTYYHKGFSYAYSRKRECIITIMPENKNPNLNAMNK